MSFGDSAEALVGKLHGQVLRLMALHSGKHFAGVAQAARSLPLAGRTKKRLQRLDAAFTVLRHITQPFADQFLKEVAAELEHLQPMRPTCSNPPSASAPAVRAESYLLDEHEALEAEVEDALWRFPAQVNDVSADGNSPTLAQSGAETRAAGDAEFRGLAWADVIDSDEDIPDAGPKVDPVEVPIPDGSSLNDTLGTPNEEDEEEEEGLTDEDDAQKYHMEATDVEDSGEWARHLRGLQGWRPGLSKVLFRCRDCGQKVHETRLHAHVRWCDAQSQW